MEGMTFDSPKGTVLFRREDHQLLQPMYAFKIKICGQGTSSKVRTTSLSRRKSYCLKCSKPKPGPPVVSISTMRERPIPPGRSHAGMALGAPTDVFAFAAAVGGPTGLLGRRLFWWDGNCPEIWAVGSAPTGDLAPLSLERVSETPAFGALCAATNPRAERPKANNAATTISVTRIATSVTNATQPSGLERAIGPKLGHVFKPLRRIHLLSRVAVRRADFKRNPDFFSVGGYDGMHAIDAALKKSGGKTDGESLVSAAKGLSWESPRGPISIDPETRDIVRALAPWFRDRDHPCVRTPGNAGKACVRRSKTRALA